MDPLQAIFVLDLPTAGSFCRRVVIVISITQTGTRTRQEMSHGSNDWVSEGGGGGGEAVSSHSPGDGLGGGVGGWVVDLWNPYVPRSVRAAVNAAVGISNNPLRAQ